MATQNFFELLGDEESDPSAVIERAAAMEKTKKRQQPQPQQDQQEQQAPAKLPSKPLPPAQSVRESKASQYDSGRGRGGRGGGRGGYGNRGRERDGAFNRPPRDETFQGGQGNYPDRSEGYNRDGNGFQGIRGRFYGRDRPASFPVEDGEGGKHFEHGRGRGRGRGRGQGRGFGERPDGRGPFYGDGMIGQEQQQRNYAKKDVDEGASWGKETEVGANQERVEVNMIAEEKRDVVDKQPVEETKAENGTVEEKKEEEDNEMLLDEYYKALEEKTKHLKSRRTEERKVVVDQDFDRMTVVDKKQDEGAFVMPGYQKDKGKKKEAATDKDDKPRKSLNINEFLRPAEGEDYYMPASRRGRGRGRGRGWNDRSGGYRGGFGGGSYNTTRQDAAPHIEDPSQFPTLVGAK